MINDRKSKHVLKKKFLGDFLLLFYRKMIIDFTRVYYDYDKKGERMMKKVKQGISESAILRKIRLFHLIAGKKKQKQNFQEKLEDIE